MYDLGFHCYFLSWLHTNALLKLARGKKNNYIHIPIGATTTIKGLAVFLRKLHYIVKLIHLNWEVSESILYYTLPG